MVGEESQDVLAACEEYLENTSALLRELGATDVGVAAVIDDTHDHRDRVVVVVGEEQRGKSTLINALVGAGEVIPESVQGALVPIHVIAPNSTMQDGQVAIGFGREIEPIDREELAGWVTQSATPKLVPQHNGQLAKEAYIAVADSQLGDVDIVNTPGVGSADAKRTRLIATTAQKAGVLLFVTDAAGQLTVPEMEFLKDADAKNLDIVVVVTKIDKHTLQWREIVKENSRLIQRHLGRKLPVIGVSSLLAEKEYSGIPRLRRQTLSYFENHRFYVFDRAVGDFLRQLQKQEKALIRRMGDLDQDGTDYNIRLERLEQKRSKLQISVQDAEFEIESELFAIAKEVSAAFATALDGLRDQWNETIKKTPLRTLRKESQQLTVGFSEDLKAAVEAAQNDYFSKIKQRVVEPRFGTAFAWARFIEVSRSYLGTGSFDEYEARRNGDIDLEALLSSSVIGGKVQRYHKLMQDPITLVVTGLVDLGVFGFSLMQKPKDTLLHDIDELIRTASRSGFMLYEGQVQNVSKRYICDRYQDYVNELLQNIDAKEQSLRADAASDSTERSLRHEAAETQLDSVRSAYREGKSLLVTLQKMAEAN